MTIFVRSALGAAVVVIAIISGLLVTMPAYAQADFVGRMMSMAIEASRQAQAAKQGAGSQRAAPLSADNQTMLIQRQLNALGYNTGTPDGRMGDATRRAIRAWQADNHFQTTGKLSNEQLEALLGAPASSEGAADADEAADGGSGLIRLLNDTDLPQNDYRSGMNDPALKRISLPACQQMCMADGRCGAFTYNSKARVCFLKTVASQPVPFHGAVSGIKDDVTQAADAGAEPQPGSEGQSDVADADVSGPAISADTEAKLKAIGLTLRNGEIVTGSGVVGFNEGSDGLERLEALLILKAVPTILEEPAQTADFAAILPSSETDKYLDRSIYPRWKGDSQFARDDNRAAFLRDKADELRALIPDLPLTIVDRRMVEVGQYDYDRQTLAVELSRYSVWVESNGPRLTADIPTTLPRSIVVPKDLARAIVERTVPGAAALPRDGYRLTAALRYVIRGVRVGKNGVSLDIAMLDNTLYADRNLTVPIMPIPLDEHSVLANPPAVSKPAQTTASTPPVFDTTLARFLAVKDDASLMQQPAFVATSFAIRQASERAFLANTRMEPPNFPRMMPAALLSDDGLKPTLEEVQSFTEWFQQYLPAVGAEMTFGSDVTYRYKQLSEIARGASSDEEALLRDRYPNSLAFGRLEAGPDLTVLYGLHPSPHWTDTTLLAAYPTDQPVDVRVTVRIENSQITSPVGGKRYLLLDLVPAQIAVSMAGATKLIDLPETAEPSVASQSDGSAPVSRFEVLGIKLGMKVDEAKAIIDKRFAGATISPLQVSSPYKDGSPCFMVMNRGQREISAAQYDLDYANKNGNSDQVPQIQARLDAARKELASSLRSSNCPTPDASPLQFAFGYDIVHSDALTERVAVYQVGSLVGPPVVSAIFRHFSPDGVGTLLKDGLQKTYGTDFVKVEGHDHERVWVDDPQQAARFGQHADERCISFWKDDDSFPSQYLDFDCGAYIRANDYRMVLIDTRFTSRALRAAEATQAAEKKRTTPTLQF